MQEKVFIMRVDPVSPPVFVDLNGALSQKSFFVYVKIHVKMIFASLSPFKSTNPAVEKRCLVVKILFRVC